MQKLKESQKREKVAKGKNKEVELSIEDLEQMAIDRAFVRIISWKGIQEDGQDLTFNRENAERILKDHPWIREAVMEESDNLLNFR